MKHVFIFFIVLLLIFVLGGCASGTQYDKNGTVTKKVTAYISCFDGTVKVINVKNYQVVANHCTVVCDFEGHTYILSPVNVTIEEEEVK